MARVRAFTLVELLVVIAIVIVLLSLLAPVLDTAIDLGITTKCAAHQHQLLNILNAYALDENKRKYPSGVREEPVEEAGVDSPIFVPFDFVRIVESYSGNNKSVRAAQQAGTVQWGMVPPLLVDPAYRDFGYRHELYGYVIGYNYLGGHPYLTRVNRDRGWRSPISLSDQGTGQMIACHNTWSNGSWSVAAHTLDGPLGEDKAIDGYFYRGPGAGSDTKHPPMSSDGANVGRADGSAGWHDIDALNVYIASTNRNGSAGAFGARW